MKFDSHSFHLVDQSPWPLIMSLSIFSLMSNTFIWMSTKSEIQFVIFSLISTLMIFFQWMRDIIRESTLQGFHSLKVCMGIYTGMILFISSEVMFFFSFFFSFFLLALNPDPEIGLNWPPTGIEPLDFFSIPLLNTILLLSSGMSITWSHYSILSAKLKQSMVSLLLTIFLGIVFSFFQFIEYKESSFSMADSVYGSIFFISTGFHGIHVIVGIVMILVSLMRISLMQMSKTHHLGFEASSWYWHFVDVVWLFLFVTIYWWGS